MSANSINSISEFLLHAGTECHVFDMGRRLVAIDNQTFLDIENGRAYAPNPRQQHAWFGIVFWNKQSSSQHYIWFVKLPLDEQGLVVTATRNHFLEIIVDALGQSIAQDTEKAQTLPDNPYSFVPNQSLLAQFNAMVKHQLNQPLSEGIDKVEAYVQAPQLVDWQSISMQCVADFAHGFHKHPKREALEKALETNITLYSDVFLNTFMEMCENIELNTSVKSIFMGLLDKGNSINLAALRALSCEKTDEKIQGKLSMLLKSEISLRIDVLSVIAARHYEQFNDELLCTFLEQASQLDDKENHQGALFSGFYADLVQIPKLRRQVLTLLHSPERSHVLASAFKQLFSQTRG